MHGVCVCAHPNANLFTIACYRAPGTTFSYAAWEMQQAIAIPSSSLGILERCGGGGLHTRLHIRTRT